MNTRDFAYVFLIADPDPARPGMVRWAITYSRVSSGDWYALVDPPLATLLTAPAGPTRPGETEATAAAAAWCRSHLAWDAITLIRVPAHSAVFDNQWQMVERAPDGR